MFILLIILIHIIHANNSCNARTSIYTQHGYSNTNSWYVDETTYAASTDSMTAQNYRNHIRNTIVCTGRWCVDGKWNCAPGNSRDCYNVEHIIPKANSIKEISGCSLDILGNYVMAYGAWNQALSNGYYGEKVTIYGSDIFASAYKSVYKACHGSYPSYYPIELCLSSSSSTTIFFTVMFILAFLILIFVMCYIIYNKTDKSNNLLYELNNEQLNDEFDNKLMVEIDNNIN